MTALAMRSAGTINAVSELHGTVTREMFAPLWPDEPPGDRPVGAITNGVHVPTWVAGELGRLFERHLSAAWREQYEDPAFWARILDIPDEDLWAARIDAPDGALPVRARARPRSGGPMTTPAPRASSRRAPCSTPPRSRLASRGDLPATSARTCSFAISTGWCGS